MRRALLAVAVLAALFAALAWLAPPPGVVARNVERAVDATPLFYTESDRLPALEQALATRAVPSSSLERDSTSATDP